MRKRINWVSVVVFLAALTGLFCLSPRGVQKLQAGFLGMIGPFLEQGSNLERQFSVFREGLKTLGQLEEDNKRLRVANKELSATNQTLRGLEAENNRLRNALGYRERARFKLLPARITVRKSSTWYSTVIIDRGSADGLRPDMSVLTEKGLVGKTQVVSESDSTVLLITDENCKVAARVEGSSEQGIVRGERAVGVGVPPIGLQYLSKQANLGPGQKVYTSGIGGVFPEGVFIGKVRKFEVRELDGYSAIDPEVDLTTIEDVFVVVGENK